MPYAPTSGMDGLTAWTGFAPRRSRGSGEREGRCCSGGHLVVSRVRLRGPAEFKQVRSRQCCGWWRRWVTGATVVLGRIRVMRRRKGADHSLSARKSIRKARPDGGPDLRHLRQPVGEQDPDDPGVGGPQQGRTVFHSDQRLLGEPDRGPVRAATHLHHGELEPPNHTVLAQEMQKYLRWRNANARHPDVLAAQRRERARVRSERQQRWGRPCTKAV